MRLGARTARSVRARGRDDVQATVVIVEDNPRIAAHVAQGVSAHGGLTLLGTAGSLTEARALIDSGTDLFHPRPWPARRQRDRPDRGDSRATGTGAQDPGAVGAG